MATETVIYVSLALVLLTRIYVFISPPDFLQEHQDPHYQEYHLYRQYHIRKQKKRPPPPPLSTSHSLDSDAPLSPISPLVSRYDSGDETPYALSPLTPPTITNFPTVLATAATTIPSSPSTTSLLSTLSQQRNASTATLSPPKEPTPLKPLSDAYPSPPHVLSPPSTSTSLSSSSEQYVLERFEHHAPHEELLLVGVGPVEAAAALLQQPSHLAQQQDHQAYHHSAPHRTSRRSVASPSPSATTVEYTQENISKGTSGSIKNKHSTEMDDEEDAGETEEEASRRYNYRDIKDSLINNRSQSLRLSSPPLDPSPLSSLDFDTFQSPASPLSCSPLDSPFNLNKNNSGSNQNEGSNPDSHDHQRELEARMRSIMATMSLLSLHKPPSYLSLSISDIEYSRTSAAIQYPKAITAQFDADKGLQAQITVLRSSLNPEEVYNRLMKHQDMTVVWEGGRWCCLEDNNNRLLYVLRQIGWQGQIRVKVLVDRDGVDGGDQQQHHGPSVIAVTEESWKAAGMDKMFLASSGSSSLTTTVGGTGRRDDEKGDPVARPAAVYHETTVTSHIIRRNKQEATVPLHESTMSSSLSEGEDKASLHHRQRCYHRPRQSPGQRSKKTVGLHQRHEHAQATFIGGLGQQQYNFKDAQAANEESNPGGYDLGAVTKQGHKGLVSIASSTSSPFSAREFSLLLLQQQRRESAPRGQHQPRHRRPARLSSISSLARHGQDLSYRHQHQYQSLINVRRRWEEGQDTDADADDEIDDSGAYDEYTMGSDDEDMEVDEEDEVDDEGEAPDEEDEDGDDNAEEEEEAYLVGQDDTRHLQHRHNTRHPSIQRSHTYPRANGASRFSHGLTLMGSITGTGIDTATTLVPLSISSPQIKSLQHLGILNRLPSQNDGDIIHNNTSSATSKPDKQGWNTSTINSRDSTDQVPILAPPSMKSSQRPRSSPCETYGIDDDVAGIGVGAMGGDLARGINTANGAGGDRDGGEKSLFLPSRPGNPLQQEQQRNSSGLATTVMAGSIATSTRSFNLEQKLAGDSLFPHCTPFSPHLCFSSQVPAAGQQRHGGFGLRGEDVQQQQPPTALSASIPKPPLSFMSSSAKGKIDEQVNSLLRASSMSSGEEELTASTGHQNANNEETDPQPTHDDVSSKRSLPRYHHEEGDNVAARRWGRIQPISSGKNVITTTTMTILSNSSNSAATDSETNALYSRPPLLQDAQAQQHVHAVDQQQQELLVSSPHESEAMPLSISLPPAQHSQLQGTTPGPSSFSPSRGNRGRQPSPPTRTAEERHGRHASIPEFTLPLPVNHHHAVYEMALSSLSPSHNVTPNPTFLVEEEGEEKGDKVLVSQTPERRDSGHGECERAGVVEE